MRRWHTPGASLSLPAKNGSRLTTAQKWLAAICVVLAVSILGVIGCRSIFEEPEIPTVENKKPPVFTEPSGSTSEEPPEEIVYDDGLTPKMDGERKSDKYYTILILGRDTGGGGNTDTMLLASYDVTNQKATVMSIPRDTMVNVSWDGKKINTPGRGPGRAVGDMIWFATIDRQALADELDLELDELLDIPDF